MSDVVVAGAEPFASEGGPEAVLMLHGLTATPLTLYGLAQRTAAAGFTVSLPCLPGHGTSVEDMQSTCWDDWSGAALAAYDELAARASRVAVVGLSMGGTLAAYVAAHRRDVAALVFINPLIKPTDPALEEMGEALLAAGVTTYESIGSDIKKEGAPASSYDATPVAPALSLLRALEGVQESLSSITAPSLLLTSTEDHLVSVDNGEELVARSRGPVQRIWLDDSYHVATLDNDAELVESATLRFLEEELRSE